MVRAMSGQIEPDKTSPLPMMVVKTLISMVPFFLVFVFRTFIRIVFAL